MIRFFLFLLLPGALSAQCNLSVSGKVLDGHHDDPLQYATILIEETGEGAVADDEGFFELSALCPGEYHLRVSHVGCEHVHLFISLVNDTLLTVFLEHHTEHLDDLVITAENVSTMTSGTRVESEMASGANLATALSQVVGVSTISTGSGIAKPVIHGLYGNRISIINNGLEQAGQRWGNDHAPEIDLNSGGFAKVVKGVSSIAYGGNGLGGAVVVDQKPVAKDPHVHGATAYSFNTNGLGHNLSFNIEKSGKILDWRLHGSGLLTGDSKAPDYFLTNTGRREYSGGIFLEKSAGERWFNRFYYSLFRTEIGLLRGSHIGNLSDLEEAIGRDEPFFTADEFSYSIENPLQQVVHHLGKISSRYHFNKQQSLHLQYGFQHNRRKEFDTRRGAIAEFPALDLKLQAHELRSEYSWTRENSRLLTGLLFSYRENDNDPSTGTLPLIPDYSRLNNALFAVWFSGLAKWDVEIGARLDQIGLYVFDIKRTPPYDIEMVNRNFLNYSTAASLSNSSVDDFTPKLQLGLTRRSPAVNELFSAGLHQGVSGIEEGDRNLTAETSYKAILDLNYDWKEKVFVAVSGYTQYVSDYIFLQPTNEIRLTVQGAFPVFEYRQTDATLTGLDAIVNLHPVAQFEAIFRFAMVRGWDRSNAQHLVYMPADNLSGEFKYAFEDLGPVHEIKLGVNARYVFRQSGLEEDQDFLAAPDGYFVLGAQAAADFVLSGLDLELGFKVQNMLNNSYRDYLNRLRYFADEQGVNFRLRLEVDF